MPPLKSQSPALMSTDGKSVDFCQYVQCFYYGHANQRAPMFILTVHRCLARILSPIVPARPPPESCSLQNTAVYPNRSPPCMTGLSEPCSLHPTDRLASNHQPCEGTTRRWVFQRVFIGFKPVLIESLCRCSLGGGWSTGRTRHTHTHSYCVYSFTHSTGNF